MESDGPGVNGRGPGIDMLRGGSHFTVSWFPSEDGRAREWFGWTGAIPDCS